MFFGRWTNIHHEVMLSQVGSQQPLAKLHADFCIFVQPQAEGRHVHWNSRGANSGVVFSPEYRRSNLLTGFRRTSKRWLWKFAWPTVWKVVLLDVQEHSGHWTTPVVTGKLYLVDYPSTTRANWSCWRPTKLPPIRNDLLPPTAWSIRKLIKVTTNGVRGIMDDRTKLHQCVVCPIYLLLIWKVPIPHCVDLESKAWKVMIFEGS